MIIYFCRYLGQSARSFYFVILSVYFRLNGFKIIDKD